MNNTVEKIKELRVKINKLETTYKRGIPPFEGFTIDLCFGGNRHTDIERIGIGSISDTETAGKDFYNLILNSLKNSLQYWEKQAESELKELSITLANKS